MIKNVTFSDLTNIRTTTRQKNHIREEMSKCDGNIFCSSNFYTFGFIYIDQAGIDCVCGMDGRKSFLPTI